MALAEQFSQTVDSLPADWSDLEFDLRIADESRYIEAAVAVSACNAQPYSRSDWHWRLICAHNFGHAAAAETVAAVLAQLDDAGIEGEMVLREVRQGRVEVVETWGRPESATAEFLRRRAQ